MTNNSSSIRDFTYKTLIAVGIIILSYLLLALFFKIPQILLLIFISILFAVLLDGLVKLVSKKLKIKRGWLILIIILVLLGILTVAGIFLGPPIAAQFSKLGQRLPEAIDDFISDLKQTSFGGTMLQNIPRTKEIAPSGETVMKLVTSVFSSGMEISVDIIVVFLLGIYLASNPSLYIDNLILLLPAGKRDRAHVIAQKMGHALRYWLLGRVIIMLSVTIVTSIGLWVIGMPSFFALGLITGLFSFIPYLGAIAAFIPVVLIALVESSSLAFSAAIVYTVLHNIEGYVLTPIIQEHVVSIPPALLIVMQILMFFLFGAMGAAVATPLAIVIIIFIQMVYIEDILKDKVKVIG